MLRLLIYYPQGWGVAAAVVSPRTNNAFPKPKQNNTDICVQKISSLSYEELEAPRHKQFEIFKYMYVAFLIYIYIYQTPIVRTTKEHPQHRGVRTPPTIDGSEHPHDKRVIAPQQLHKKSLAKLRKV